MIVNLDGRGTALKQLRDEPNHIVLVSEQATRRALNRTLDKARTLVSQRIREQVNLKAAYVKEKLKLRKARVGESTARIIVSHDRVLLSRYGARQTNHGVTVRVKRNGPRERLPGAFLLRLSNGATGVALRRVVDGQRVGRTPIDVLYGPSVYQVFRDVREDVAPELEQLLGANLERELAREFAG